MRWLGTILNFFLPGLGYVVAGPDTPKRILGVPMALAFACLSYVEQVMIAGTPAFGVMAGCVFLFNTAFAVDTYRVLAAAKPA